MNKYRLARIICYLIPAGYFIASLHLPFWGDAVASVSKAALNIYVNGLDQPWNVPEADPGHPTLFPWIIALVWMIAGKSLWIVHLLIAVCSILLLRFIELSGRHLVRENYLLALMAFVVISPLFVSQSTGISLQLPLTLLFFASFHYLRKDKRIPATLLMCLMMLVHLQALFLLAALFLFDSWKNLRWKKMLAFFPSAAAYLIPLSVFLLWLYLHEKQFGWALITPNYTREQPGFSQMLYNTGIAVWRIMDLGYFIVMIPAMVWSFKRLKKRLSGDAEKIFLILLAVLVLIIPSIFIYPPNHRYFFPLYLFALILFFRYLQGIPVRKGAFLSLIAIILLLIGNFFYYPGKCLGDQNLAYLSYFEAEKEVAGAIGTEVPYYSKAPLNNHDRYTYINRKGLIQHADLYSAQWDTVPLILQSNLNCDFTPEEMNFLSQRFWQHSYTSGPVYLNVFINKKMDERWPDLQFNKVRQPGPIENIMVKIKSALRGE